MKRLCKLLICLFVYAGPLAALSPLVSFFEKEWETPQTFAQHIDHDIEVLKKQRGEAEKAQALVKARLDEVQKKVSSYKERAQRVRGVELEYVNQQLALTNKTVQVLNELKQLYQNFIGIYDDHIKLLQQYKQDPECRACEFLVEPKSIYSIDDYQKINSSVLRFDTELKTLEERLKKLSLDNEALKKNVSLARQELEDKERERHELKKGTLTDERVERKKLTPSQFGALLDAEERLLGFKKELADAFLKEADAKAHFTEQSIKVTKILKELLERDEEQVKQELRIDKKDIAAADASLKKTVAQSNRTQEELGKALEGLNELRKNEVSQLETLQKQLKLNKTDLESFAKWQYQPSTLAEWKALELGRINNGITYHIDVAKDILFAKIAQEKQKVTDQEVQNQIIHSWQGLTTGAFEGYYQHDALLKEIKKYEKLKADIQTSLGSLEDKRVAAVTILNQYSALLDTIKARIENFKEQKDTTFKANPELYSMVAQLLGKEVGTLAQDRKEAIAQLLQLYDTMSASLTMTGKKVDGMLDVLKDKTQWGRAPSLLKSVKKFIPELSNFVNYVFNSKQLGASIERTQKSLGDSFTQLKKHPLSILQLLLYALILILLFGVIRVLFKQFVPDWVVNALPRHALHHVFLYIWFVLLFLVRYQIIDRYMGVLFYLLSIPFWLYLASRLIGYCKAVNSERGYYFASKQYQQKFFRVFSILLYASLIILFIREALILAFPKSDAPRTLLALNFVLLQISLILMLSREQVLSFIPRTSKLWEWLAENVATYYYLFLSVAIFLIVMSNPYIGYGPHFFFAVTRLVLIGLLIPLFVSIHGYAKQWFSSLFFYSDDEGTKERFKYGRTLFGFFIIASFFFLSICAMIIAANIWGYSIGFEEISSWFHREIYAYKNQDTGREVGVNPIHIAKVFLYFFGGIALATFINKFVLRRLFDLLLVNVGVQSALLSLTRYLIIMLAIIFGLQSIGLSYSLFYVFAVLGGLGVAGKEIITDFIGYFVILIQRPLKIGDFVKVNEEVTGVVRHLTLRSVILRRNNSVTVIIPNSFVMTKMVTNWNYSRNFFAFDDIKIVVIYGADPYKVKELMLDVLDKNINILKNPAPIVRLEDFVDNGFQFMVRGYLSPDKVLDQFDIASDVRLQLVRTLRASGYDVGSPTRFVKVVQPRLDEPHQ